jgi:hypothetical protein
MKITLLILSASLYIVTEVDSCVSVAAQFKLTEADFYAMVSENQCLHSKLD